MVPGFLPSSWGLPFANDFPSAPVLVVSLPGIGSIGLGDASLGLCGGMVFTVRDYFEAGIRPPVATTPPAGGTPLFRYIARRLLDSWMLPVGALRYWQWMILPDQDSRLGRGVIRRTVREEWPRIREDLRRGKLVPLGQVKLHSVNPARMGENHQVLAYGYDWNEDTGDVRLYIYDPNHPGDDNLSLDFNVRLPLSEVRITCTSGERVRGFFRTVYRPPGPLGLKLPAC